MTFCINKECAKYLTCYRNYDKAKETQSQSPNSFVRELPICVSSFLCYEEKTKENEKEISN